MNASSFVIGSLAVLACVASPRATERGPLESAPSTTPVQLARSSRDLPTIVDVKPLMNEPLLQIENLRLESAPAKAPQPSVLLKFDVLNDTSLPLTDLVMRVSFLEKPADETGTATSRVLVGPVTVRVGETLAAGYVISYEMLFRNLSFDCDCAPRVEILSARQLPD